MDAKCGEQKRWHWAHHRTTNCDPWWENETPWHRRWKSYFPEDWREVLHEAPSVEKHIADVKTPNGIVFEFQNSPMQTEELRSRENFYGQVIWVVNGEKFRDNYTVLDRLPDPKAEFAEDLVFHQQSLNKPYFCYGRKDRNPDASESYRMGWILSPDELGEEGIQQLIDEAYSGYHWFDWKHRREVWFASKQPVLLDLVVPGNMLAEFCIRLVSAKALIE
jgi:hypothetical protein